ncbi:hypothetical protein B0T22DRAFT_495555 [Podospora appendiculata]|uniref:Uncharacterized protein n=1 Tax=Podospora appendiculata TaxID=314037 RepID=A0AAE0XFN3_9PEZI|nr:hypothetical protein B0T22DRAFT_495555 [Podospora appendiculata]
MQAVPSLVGTGTVVAAAAAGLVFAQPPESDPPRPSSSKRKYAPDFDITRMQHASSSPITRPATHTASPLEEFPYSSFRQFSDPVPSPLSSHPPTMTTTTGAQRPPMSVQVSSPKPTNRRYSLIRPSEHGSGSTGEPRDSVSSRDSWIRRLSLRPMSQHGSPRSSMGPDSPSLTFSYASGAPILDPKAAASQTKPNKLVKRTTSGHNGTPEGQSGRGLRSQMPTLRRPATSHQRSATLQQFQQHQGGFPSPPLPDIRFSLDRQIQPKELIRPLSEVIDLKQASGRWTSFFHTRITRSSGRGSGARPSESSPYASPLPQRRISLRIGFASRAYLAKANQISGSPIPIDEIDIPYQKADAKDGSQDTSSPTDSTDTTPSRRARRSISMHFSSPNNWISKPGSIRRPKRGSPDGKSSSPRHVSAPVEVTHDPSPPGDKPTLEDGSRPVEPQGHSEPELKPAAQIKSRQRNLSSPLPPLSRLSNFNIDVPRAGLSSSSSSTPPRPFPHPINYTSGSLAYSALPRSRGGSGERASTLAGSDGVSGDDEDTDFKSDGMFDSFRTIASSNRLRTVETPLESMFDESPPSTAGNSKTKRLSIQEILGRSWDGDTKIMEEDESLQTPIRVAHLADPVEFSCRDQDDDEFSFDATPDLSLGNRDFGRLSLDDDDDDDWARDDENTLSNHLSPPSSSTNSRRVSPTFRHVLINISGNDGGLQGDLSERPRSNIFDWCEPSNLDKFDVDGQSLRPKTVHGKQELDLRGGRSVNRKGPSATHVRSQSVPVVPDPCDTSKPAPKFGTWGLGTKTASEDWDDDFDFDEGAAKEAGGKDSATSFSMVVPASIQATQPTVKAHSGQIRELSLLVNDLKRLCRHGKDLDILHGVLHHKWKEAENIIALASPDEDTAEDSDSNEPTMDFDRSKIDERYLEEGFDGPILDYPDDPFGTPEPEMGKTTVVRERQAVRRRSVFSPDDDIFGHSWPLAEESARLLRPHTPDGTRSPSRNSAIIATVIEAMQQQQRQASGSVKSMAPSKPSDSKLFFDTNSLQELVKRAGQLRDSLSDAVRRAELLTQSPAGTPRRERHVRHNHDGSPAFTRVFTDPAASPPKRLPKSHSTNSVLSKTSVDSPRMQMMIVN